MKKLWDFSGTVAFYKGLRFNNLTSPKYRHLFLLVYWALYGFLFLSVERLIPVWYLELTGKEFVYHAVECAWDAYIPFCEWFVIPYYFWFAYMAVFGAFWLFRDVRAFREFMWWIIISYSVCMVVYFIYPTMQEFRPETFPRDNLFTRICGLLYNFDTNTNVCPSIHVLGSCAVCFPGVHCKSLCGKGWKTFFIVACVLISISTVFLRQHSILDILFAVIEVAVCYPLVMFCTNRWDAGSEVDIDGLS